MRKFDSYFKQCVDAIELLHMNHMYVQAVTLTYLYIDHMCWLNVEGRNTPKDFKEWVDKYMTDINPFGCSALDLWEARNGLIHTGSDESDKYAERGAKKIHYYRKVEIQHVKPQPDTVLIDMDSLIMSFIAGILHFRLDLEKDAAQKAIADTKIDKVMKNIHLN